MENIARLQRLLQTIGDSNRLRIIHCIGKQECAVSEIVEATGLSQPLVSHHLRALKKSQILDTNRKGSFIFYRLADTRLLEVLGILSDMARHIEPSGDVPPMFKCPGWWRKMKV